MTYEARRSANNRPVGQIALHQLLGGRLPMPHVRSYIAAQARHTRETAMSTEETYPSNYATDGSLRENLRFAFKHEAIDLGVVYAALKAMGPTDIEAWARTEPTGVHSRRAWFLYEYFTGEALDLTPLTSVGYADALDPKRHYAAAAQNSPRHRIRNNLLGGPDLCPVLRRTAALEAAIASHLNQRIVEVTHNYTPDVLARAVRFLYTKETLSSFAIEGEVPSKDREERFLQALRGIMEFDAGSKEDILHLQNAIVEPRYAAKDWRDFQNFVGETTASFGEIVHFVSPRQEDVTALMHGWAHLTDRALRSENLDAVLAAALSAFAFVFIHPFDDGNGRIHRFLIHHMLAKRGFTPPGIIFPVSSAILRQRHLYDAVLEAFSSPIQPFVSWHFNFDQSLSVTNNTLNLYRFFDATPQAEYLYARIEETISTDFREELTFIERFDAAFAALRDVVDMPDVRARHLIKLLFQNNGRLPQSERRRFSELADLEVIRIEAGVQAVMRAEPTPDESSPS